VGVEETVGLELVGDYAADEVRMGGLEVGHELVELLLENGYLCIEKIRQCRKVSLLPDDRRR